MSWEKQKELKKNKKQNIKYLSGIVLILYNHIFNYMQCIYHSRPNIILINMVLVNMIDIFRDCVSKRFSCLPMRSIVGWLCSEEVCLVRASQLR